MKEVREGNLLICGPECSSKRKDPKMRCVQRTARKVCVGGTEGTHRNELGSEGGEVVRGHSRKF